MHQVPSDSPLIIGARPAITAAHFPAILLGGLLLLALLLGIVLGDIGPQTFHQPVPSPSDPITIP